MDNDNPFADPYVPSGGGYAGAPMDTSEALIECQKIRDKIFKFNEIIKEIKQLQNKQAIAVSENDKRNIIEEINELNNESRQLNYSIKSDIEILKTKINKSDIDIINQINNLNRLFRNGITDLIKIEDEFNEKIIDQGIEQYQIINPESNYEEAKEFVQLNGTEEIFSKNLDLQNRKAESFEVFQNVKYRHEEIQRINETVNMLNQMLNELQDLVVEQDYYFENANNNVNIAQNQLEQGDANVIVATKTSKKNRKCKWIIIVLILLLICIIVAVVAGLVKGLK